MTFCLNSLIKDCFLNNWEKKDYIWKNFKRLSREFLLSFLEKNLKALTNFPSSWIGLPIKQTNIMPNACY